MKIHHLPLKGCLIILTCLLLTSCVDKNKEIRFITISGKWKANPALQFDFNVDHADHPRDIVFVVRNTNAYPYSNLRLFVELKKNKEKKPFETDTLNYIMARPNGQWLGSGFGGTKEIWFLYKKDYRFPADGKYTIEVKHAMRKDPLPGIEDVGIQIEKVIKR